MKKLLTFGIFNESNICAKVYYIKKWGIAVNYCWNYGPSKLLLHFTEYRLDQLNSKHTKIAANSTMQYFEGCCQKKYLLKVFWSTHHKFLVHPPCQIFAKLDGNYLLMANVFKLHEYQTFGLMTIHNMCKIWFANKYSICEKVWFTINAPSKMVFFYFLRFPFTQISNDYCQKSYNGFWGFLVISSTSQIFLIYTFVTMKRRDF